VDGFRWHAAPTLIRRGEATHGEYTGWHLIRDVNRELRELKKITIAEDVDETPEDRTQLELGENGARCDLVWDARFMQRLHAVLQANETERDMGLLAAALPATFPRVLYSDSYEEARKPTRIPRTETAAEELALLGMAFVLTAPGVPMLFQGQELIDRTVFSSHSSVDWSSANAHQAQLAVVRQLIRCRRNLDGTTPGLTGEQIDIRLRDDAQQVIGYWRWDGAKETPKNCTVVVANLRGRDAQFRMEVPESGTWTSRCTSWGKAITVAESDGHFVMGLPPYGFAVLSRQT
jgi:1,4-alpha-glucan branching enzyme